MTTPVTRPEFKARVDSLLRSFVERFYREVPGGRHLAGAERINLEYYKRNLVEIILRLRMKRTIDALTIHYFTKHDPRLAKKWAEYTADEMLHDGMFAKDLERVGVAKPEIYAHEPLFSTQLLQGYFYYGIEHQGKPLASLCSSYFLETVSLLIQPGWIENVESVMGSGSAAGQRAHVDHDLEDDHDEFVWEVLMTFVDGPEDEDRIIQHLTNVYKLFCAFYTELYMLTFDAESDAGEQAKAAGVDPVIKQLVAPN